MPLPTPQNCRFNDSGGIDFEAEVEGQMRKATITIEAVRALYAANPDLLGAVSRSSYVTRLVAHYLRAGQPEPVFISATMLSDAGLPR